MIDFANYEPISLNEVEVGNVIRFSYKKEKQANWATRLGVVTEVKRNNKGEVESILVNDHVASKEEYLEDVEPRRFLASRIGSVDRYPEVMVPASKPVPVEEEVVTFTIPKGKKAYLRIENRQ